MFAVLNRAISRRSSCTLWRNSSIVVATLPFYTRGVRAVHKTEHLSAVFGSNTPGDPKSLTLPRWFGWEAGLFLLAPQTPEDVQHSGHERIWARVRPERYGFKRWNIGLERPEDHPPCRQFLR